ncbi:unnamed protein product, partial [Brenthis ino]
MWSRSLKIGFHVTNANYGHMRSARVEEIKEDRSSNTESLSYHWSEEIHTYMEYAILPERYRSKQVLEPMKRIRMIQDVKEELKDAYKSYPYLTAKAV